jgi:hypothetical protein
MDDVYGIGMDTVRDISGTLYREDAYQAMLDDGQEITGFMWTEVAIGEVD